MTEVLTLGPVPAEARRSVIPALAVRETRRLLVNPVFLFAVAITV